VSDLQARISALSPAKRALLERRLREKAERQQTEPIQPRSSPVNPPLSFGQERFWFLYQWEPANPAYNTSIVTRMDGPLDAGAVDLSLTEIARRHEALRTTFASESGTPVQIIHPAIPIAAVRVDLTALSREQNDAELARLIHDENVRPFDLVRGPIWRATLVQLDPCTHVLVLMVHHIVFDGWSVGPLYREFVALYEAFARGDDSPLPELPIQYADFAVWQKRRLRDDLLTRQLSYWREQLREVTVLDLPTDHPRPPVQTFTGAAHEMRLPRDVVEGLKSLGRSEHATLFQTLLAAFQALLHRYTGQDDIVVGTPIAGRTRVEVEQLIGFFVNMLVLRTDSAGDPTFRDFLGRVARVAFDAYAHQDIPFERLVGDLHPVRDPSRNPFFQVVFALQNAPRPSPSIGQLTLTRIATQKPYTRFDLEVHFHEIEDGLVGRFVYNTTLFDAPTIARMTRHFRVLLDAIVADPDVRLSRLPLLTSEERHQILVKWNRTETAYPRDACVHTLFEAQAIASPDAVAVAFGEQRLTYRQLNERANRLAHHLKYLGVGPDAVVAVCVERSIEMIVGFLGILKAGGAYMPLEPSYPRERLAFMLNDTAVRVLVTSKTLLPLIPESRARVTLLDDRHLEHNRSENPGSGATATNLAYVLYTSGSTGQPKGVAVPHRAVVRLVVDTNYVQLGPADRVAQASNASFDAATFEIWGALLQGASVVGIPQTVLLSPRDFARAIQAQNISTLFLTTALFNQIASEAPAAFRSLRYLLVGGETCDPKWMRVIIQSGPPQCLLNVYGPTENTTFTTWHRVERVAEATATVPIGRPVANTRVYLLDGHLQPVPIGVVGELYAGGDGLAREYLNRPELTSERFARDPFDADPSSRIYRTGDFARWLPDGSIDFVGRIDGQIKLRGFRIELQEIEATLAQHPDVGKVIVVAKQRVGGEKSLVGYVVPANGNRPSSDALRSFLREKLPDYMVPSSFGVLDSLPLTPNGKIDQAALPEPGEEIRPSFQEPRTAVERTIARIWQELLGVASVTTCDNFFDLGGHSLLAVQLIGRLEKRFGRTLPVAALFQSPTIEQLAAMFTDDRREESWSCLIPVQEDGSQLPFIWVHGDASTAHLPEYLGPDRPLYAFEHQAHDGRAARHTRVDTIAAHYIEELRTIRPHGPYLLGGYSFGAATAFEMARQLVRDGEQVPLLFMLDPPGKVREPSPTVRERLHEHVVELSRLGPRGKLGYVLRVIDMFGRQRYWRTRDAVKGGVRRLRWKACLRQGSMLPPSLRSPYILDVYRGALRTYAPSRYSGRVLIFMRGTMPYGPPMDWMHLTACEIQIYDGTCEHTDLTKEPYLSMWAGRLRESLDGVALP
jgi:amino acid adenylation domain-containing protein